MMDDISRVSAEERELQRLERLTRVVVDLANLTRSPNKAAAQVNVERALLAASEDIKARYVKRAN